MKKTILAILVLISVQANAQNSIETIFNELWENDQYPEILVEKEKYKEKQFSEKVLYYIGISYYINEDYKKSASFLEKAIQKGPATAKMHYFLAIDQYYLKKIDESLLHIDQAIYLNPESSFYYKEKGLILNAINETDKAIEALKIAITLPNPEAQAFCTIGDIYKENHQLKEALNAFYIAKSKINKVGDYYLSTLYEIGRIEQDFENYSKSNEAFLELIELDPQNFWVIKNIIQNYFSSDQLDLAKPYQEKLYNAYHEKTLPEGLDEHYSFERFKYNDKNVWGYEWYAKLGDPETKGSFSKHIYYIYSTDEYGNDKDLLFTIHTVKIHKSEEDMPDYVLTKRRPTNEGEISQSFWTFTFNSPVDYKELKKAVLEVLIGNVEADIESFIKK